MEQIKPNLKYSAHTALKFTDLINSIGLNQDYEFKNIQANQSELSLVCEYISVINNTNIILRVYINPDEKTYTITTETPYEVVNTAESNNYIADKIKNNSWLYGKSVSVNVENYKIIMTNTDNIPEHCEYNYIILYYAIRDFIHLTDDILLSLLDEHNSVFQTQLVYYPTIRYFDELTHYKSNYDKILIVNKPTLGNAFCIDDAASLYINTYHTDDMVFNITQNTLYALSLIKTLNFNKLISLTFNPNTNEVALQVNTPAWEDNIGEDNIGEDNIGEENDIWKDSSGDSNIGYNYGNNSTNSWNPLEDNTRHGEYIGEDSDGWDVSDTQIKGYTQQLKSSLQGIYVGINGYYTKHRTKYILLGTLNTTPELTFTPIKYPQDPLDKNDYTGNCLLHITLDEYVYREFINKL